MNGFLIKSRVRIVWIFVIGFILFGFIAGTLMFKNSFLSILVVSILSWLPVIALPCIIKCLKKDFRRKGALIYAVCNFVILTIGNVITSKYGFKLWGWVSMIIPYYILTDDSIMTGEKQPFLESFGAVFVALIECFWFTAGILQILAIYSLVDEHVHIFILNLIIALFVSNIPLLGTVLGVISAHNLWGWHWLSTIAVFVPGLLITPFLLISGVLVGTIQSLLGKDKE